MSAEILMEVVGTGLSLVGLAIAIWQIRKTRRAAEAAARSAIKAQEMFARNVLLSDLTMASAALDNLKSLIRANQYEASLLRVSDLMNQLNQIKALPNASSGTLKFTKILGQLHVLRDLLERQLSNYPNTPLDVVQVVGVLSETSDQLNTWVGRAKFMLPKETSDDS